MIALSRCSVCSYMRIYSSLLSVVAVSRFFIDTASARHTLRSVCAPGESIVTGIFFRLLIRLS